LPSGSRKEHRRDVVAHPHYLLVDVHSTVPKLSVVGVDVVG
jgi:hypothetical protein